MNTENLNTEELKNEIITTLKLGMQLKELKYVKKATFLYLFNIKFLVFHPLFIDELFELSEEAKDINYIDE